MKEFKEHVISKEDAVFWMDGNGRWRNEHGAFEHKRIIAHFHSSIKKDKDGYYLAQTHETHKEKVYFRYDDCAVFVFDVLLGEEIALTLNTGKRITLDPETLFIKEDNLYTRDGEDRIKFDQRSLMKISSAMEEDDDGRFCIRVKNERYEIKNGDR